MRNISVLLVGVVGLSFGACRAPDLNPALPQAGTGYIDFYTEAPLDLAWEVKRLDQPTGKWRTVFSEFKPVAGNILRVTAQPGTQQFEVWFRNLVTEGPQAAAIRVDASWVTPVRVTLTAAGSTSIRQERYGFRPSAKGYARGTKVTHQPAEVFKIGLVPQPLQPYKTKEQMNYCSAGSP